MFFAYTFYTIIMPTLEQSFISFLTSKCQTSHSHTISTNDLVETNFRSSQSKSPHNILIWGGNGTVRNVHVRVVVKCTPLGHEAYNSHEDQGRSAAT